MSEDSARSALKAMRGKEEEEEEAEAGGIGVAALGETCSEADAWVEAEAASPRPTRLDMMKARVALL